MMKLSPGISRMSSGRGEKKKKEEDSDEDLDRDVEAKLVRRIFLFIWVWSISTLLDQTSLAPQKTPQDTLVELPV